MIYKFREMTKGMRKGSQTCVALLEQLLKAFDLPPPQYDFEHRGSNKRPQHFCKVRFRVPSRLSEYETDMGWITGSGTGGQKVQAKKMASLEAVHRLEENLSLNHGDLKAKLDEILQKRQLEKEEIEATPIEQELPGVGWENVPIDGCFAESLPATRSGRIEFFPEVREDSLAFLAAKTLTLTSHSGKLPEVTVHTGHVDAGDVRRWANIRFGAPKKKNSRTFTPTHISTLPFNLEPGEAKLISLRSFGDQLKRSHEWVPMVQMVESASTESFGMAKIFFEIPQHHHNELKDLLEEVPKFDATFEQNLNESRPRKQTRTQLSAPELKEEAKKRASRLNTFRAHQQEFPLPVDSIEKDMDHEAHVTIVRGTPGCGKTTRYPLMLSLLSPDDSTRVVVAQPRRLACQAAAQRVAQEQDSRLGSKDCPIGYAIRFESARSVGSRTVDFQTPGVLLRRVMDDPLLQDVTHLVIDEVHERNADMDLLLTLGKKAAAARAMHKTLPPLRLILMSATLDASHWEKYFGDVGSVAFLDVPEVRRFPVETIYLGDNEFSRLCIGSARKLLLRRNQGDYDEDLCAVTAELVMRLVEMERTVEGSILCFLPGIEEIRHVHRLLRAGEERYQFLVRYLHSSLSSKEQQKVFIPGTKVILSTNIAETSVTIPDVKVVIDAGRERQHSLLKSSEKSETTATVVGAQLLTVDISQASAKQRAGRAGRVSAGTCFRLYTRDDMESKFLPYTGPEMQRMDLSQLVLHTLFMYGGGHPLQLLLDTPDPPSKDRLQQTLRGLVQQGHVECNARKGTICLTPLGRAVALLPATPRLGRMLFLGLALQAFEPALRIAALLSIPKVFSVQERRSGLDTHSSDVVKLLQDYHEYEKEPPRDQERHPRMKLFRQVDKVKRQLEQYMQEHIQRSKTSAGDHNTTLDIKKWNTNSERIAAVVALVCGATPHIAHLVSGRNDFATRDLAGSARIHPSSVNFETQRRCHWYVYNDLLTTRQPYLNVTTAVSPVELAFFADSTTWAKHEENDDFEFLFGQNEREASDDVNENEDDEDEDDEDEDDEDEDDRGIYERYIPDDVFVADQWVPVAVSKPGQRKTMVTLRRTLNDMIQQVALDPQSVLESPAHQRVVLFVLAAIEQQRLSK